MSIYTDAKQLNEAARRACDIINSQYTLYDWDDLKGKFMAIRLRDGGSDGVLYDNKRDAVKHQANEFHCAYVAFRNLGPSGASPRDMGLFLEWNRKAYDSGYRLPDPAEQSGGPDLIMRAQDREAMRRTSILTQFDMGEVRKALGLL